MFFLGLFAWSKQSDSKSNINDIQLNVLYLLLEICPNTSYTTDISLIDKECAGKSQKEK